VTQPSFNFISVNFIYQLEIS